MNKPNMGSSGEVKLADTFEELGGQADRCGKMQEFLSKLTGLTGIRRLSFRESWKINQETNLYPVSVLSAHCDSMHTL
jgi:hypothetical protein